MKAGIDTSGYYTYPLLFYTAFPDVSLAQLRLLSLSGSYLFDYILCLDSILDNPAGSQAGSIFLSSMLQQEAFSLLYSLFPAGTPFWSYFNSYYEHFAQAMLQERVRHYGLLTPYSEAELQFIYSGKPAIGKACIAALALLGGRKDLIAPLTTSHDHFHVAYQLIDDLQDWRLDYQRRHYSYLLTYAFSEAGWKPRIESDQSPPADEVELLLQQIGVVEYTRALIFAYLDKAESVLEVNMAEGSWAAAIQQTRRHIEELQLGGEPPDITTPLPATTVLDWNASLDAQTTVTPVAPGWLPWLDRSRVPHVGARKIREAQQRALSQSGGATTIGEALCQVGLAIAYSQELCPEHNLALHLGISEGELEWCYRNEQWLDAIFSLCLEEPVCLWTPEIVPTPNPLPGWIPPGVGRYLGYRLVRCYAYGAASSDALTTGYILRHYRHQLSA